MSCSFRSKRNHKSFSQISKRIKPHRDISTLRNDSSICNIFSAKLDTLLNEEPTLRKYY